MFNLSGKENSKYSPLNRKHGVVRRKSTMEIVTLLLGFVVVICFCQSFMNMNVYADDKPLKTENLSSFKVLDGLSKENEYYTIDNEVGIDGNYYRFHLTSPHGEYDVLSVKDLLKVCNEIRIIEEFRATDEGDEAWNGAGESFKEIGRGAKQIVKEPKESAKAFARAGGKLFRGVGRFFKKKMNKEEDATAADGTDRAGSAKGMFVGKQARKFAAEVGLDVYTDNPYAKALITEVSEQRAKGSIGTSVGLFFLAPVAGLGMLSNSLTPDGFDAETEISIRDESPAELSYVITEKYKNMLGLVSEDDLKVLTALLENGNYTPREQAYIYYHLDRLTKPGEGKVVKGLMDVVKHLGKVKTPDDATFASLQLELLSGYHKHDDDLSKFAVVAGMLGAIKGNGKLFLVLPYDFADKTSDAKKMLEKIAKDAKSYGAKGTELWVAGDVTKGFTVLAKSKGIAVKGNVLLLPHFAHKEPVEK